MQTDQATRQPVLFIPHGGGPCFFMDWNPADTWVGMGHFLRSVASTLPRKPSAIVMVSAHWLEAQIRVSGHARQRLIYDYYGYQQHSYEVTYPASCNTQLAEQNARTLDDEGLEAT